MTKALIIRPEAERDLEEAYGWYEARVPGLGSDFLLSIDATLSSIQLLSHNSTGLGKPLSGSPS